MYDLKMCPLGLVGSIPARDVGMMGFDVRQNEGNHVSSGGWMGVCRGYSGIRVILKIPLSHLMSLV